MALPAPLKYACLAIAVMSIVAPNASASDGDPPSGGGQGDVLSCVDVDPWEVPPAIEIDWDCIPPGP